jgi:hypothetical protein
MDTPSLSSTVPARAVLDGVPRVHFYEGPPRCPEDTPLPTVMRALLEYLGEEDYGCKHCQRPSANCKIQCTYAYMMGVTGAAFFLSWKEGWEGDNVAIVYMSDDEPAPERWAFNAAGYEYEWVTASKGRDNEAYFRQRIIESIRQDRPLIGYGIVGPPEPGLITGYDENGDVLIGWSLFQKFPKFQADLSFEPSGYFRKRHWFTDFACQYEQALLIIGAKKEKPPLAQTYHDALKWALKVTRVPMVRPAANAPANYQKRYNGLAAYTAWANQLLHDDEFPADDEAILRFRHEVHYNAVGMVAEGRWYGAQFLMGALDYVHYHLAEDLLHAAACYAAEHDLMWKVWDLAGGIGNPDAYLKLADPAIRRQMVPIILQARDKDAEAANYIEQALAKVQ